VVNVDVAVGIGAVSVGVSVGIICINVGVEVGKVVGIASSCTNGVADEILVGMIVGRGDGTAWVGEGIFSSQPTITME
jgi:hypothetical protein